MRILVLSDSHGDSWALRDVLRQQPDIRTVIHLGDGAAEMEAIADTLRSLGTAVFQVRGNGDFGFSELPLFRTEMLDGKRVFMTHGQAFGVKYDTSELIRVARSQQADILLYGHTHVPVTTYDDGLHIMNPGSLRDGCYGVLTLSYAGILTENCVLR